MRRIFVLMYFFLFLSGCAATGPIYRPADNVNPKNAVIYVYRGTGFAFGARSAYFYINNVNVFDLDQGGYSWVSLPPGRYKLKHSWPVDVVAKSSELDIQVEAGQNLYFALNTGMCNNLSPGVCVKWGVEERTPEIGKTEIADKKFQKNFGALKLMLITGEAKSAGQ